MYTVKSTKSIKMEYFIIET